jgi:hypothetical protein
VHHYGSLWAKLPRKRTQKQSSIAFNSRSPQELLIAYWKFWNTLRAL